MATVLQSILKTLRPPVRPIDRMLSPVRLFLKHRLAGAALLMLATGIAVALANSPWKHAYHEILETHVTLNAFLFNLDYTLHHWINDGLMSIFFFVVGLEIKRELLVGELSTLRKATLPAIAALGGMIVPALLFYALNYNEATSHGWGIPMATDIAFALGVLAALGKKVPLGAKVFLTALAIVDDIGAVLVIAIFYTAHIEVNALLVGFSLLGIALLMNFMQVRHTIAYLVVGILVWLAFLHSGVHATIAAILMALVIPATTRINGRDLVDRIGLITAKLERIGLPEDTTMNSEEQQQAIYAMSDTLEHAQAPLQRLEHDLHGFVTFLVLPLFALANAGVTLHGGLITELSQPLALGVVFGLFIGKQLGITLSTWLAVKLKVADLPANVSWYQIHGTSILGGIGFTMSLFISGLAFVEPAFIEEAKVGILAGSLVSGIVGYLFLAKKSSPAPAIKASS
ncbi:MAG: Na+/H+ antiporter NhaA [Polyangiaceae bacterium]|nr:Na+/H+ antiporter NhaA [Polyangiaceae bacterium]